MAANGAAKREWRPITTTNGNNKQEHQQNGHVPHDSALSVGVVDAQDGLVRELQDEVRQLQDRIAGDCMC